MKYARGFVVYVMLALCAGAFPRAQAQEMRAYLVKDINPGQDGSQPKDLIDLNGTFLFSAWDSIHGRELWKSDGTAAGTSMLMDIYPGTRDGMMGKMTGLGNLGIFKGHSYELWRTDGTTAGTILVDSQKTITMQTKPVNMGNQLMFLSFTSSNDHQSNLCITDGTFAGSRVVKSIPEIVSTHLDAAAGGIFYITDINNSQVWRSDGTSEGTFPVVTDKIVLFMNGAGNRMYMGCIPFGEYRELWVSDGTVAGTRLLKNTQPEGPSCDVNGTLFFFSSERYNGGKNVLWKTDGTEAGTLIVAPITAVNIPDYYSTTMMPEIMISYKGALITAGNDGAHGLELWRSDGTPAGTSMIKDIAPGSAGSSPIHFRLFRDRLFFCANNNQIWSTDGTEAGTQLEAAIPALGAIDQLTPCGDRLFFVSPTDAPGGSELWAYGPAGNGARAWTHYE